jgi:hypothetical protein
MTAVGVRIGDRTVGNGDQLSSGSGFGDCAIGHAGKL